MSEPMPKPPELVQAQIASFAGERLDDLRDTKHILNNIGAISLGGIEDIYRPAGLFDFRDEFITEDNKRGAVEKGTPILAASGEDYLGYLREVGGAQYEPIAARAEMIKAYQEFQPIVTSLRAEIADPSSRKEHSDYMANGGNASVFKITHNNREYAVRVPSGRQVNAASVESHVGGAIKAKGMPHMEQIVAASYEDGVTVAELMPGREMNVLTEEDAAAITDEQLGQLIDTFLEANRRRIGIDPKPTNLFYDREEGFGLIDYNSLDNRADGTAEQNPATVLSFIPEILNNARLYAVHKPEMDTADYAAEAKIYSQNSELLMRLRNVFNSTPERAEHSARAIEEIDKRLSLNEQSVRNRLDPVWVSEVINASVANREQKEAMMASSDDPVVMSGWDTV
ncbi:MAG: hypothetical protein R3313_00215 [Candidatus Saccharimonadales bacterium]|nr:hypothetical protein [Candidatus Saccharimonadales bacterium]